MAPTNPIPLPSSHRRRLLRAAWSLAAGAWLAPTAPRWSFAQRFERDPFTLGVASGCPRPDGMVLWTRLAPEPLADGGMSPEPVRVRWELAADERCRDIVRTGESTADAELGHSVHVELRGLRPDRTYWYRFMAGDAVSPIGRTRTAPAIDADLTRLRYAFASCQQYEQGYYGAYRHMAEEDVDLVVFLGDYIYESSWGRRHVRKHSNPEPTTLPGYRNRHAQYKTDPDLQHMHALVPWIVTWDDHEVANDYADAQGQFLERDFIQRRAAAYRAYYEHMPLEQTMRPRGADMRLHDVFAYGRLAQFHVLDSRQYRVPQVCPSPKKGGGSTIVRDAECPERREPHRSLLGRAQETWLFDELARSRARWNVLAQQSIMAQVNQSTTDDPAYWTDSWDGYPQARQRLLDHLRGAKTSNPLVIGGDVHCHWVCDLKADFDRPESATVASEFCGTSISSQGWPQARVQRMLPQNPHAKFASAERRGYVVMELSKARCEVALRGIEDEKRRDTPIETQARFVVENGRPGPQRA